MFVWMFNNRRYKGGVDSKARLLSLMSQTKNWPFYFFICLCISTAVYLSIYVAKKVLARKRDSLNRDLSGNGFSSLYCRRADLANEQGVDAKDARPERNPRLNRSGAAKLLASNWYPRYFPFTRTPGAISEFDGLSAIAVLLVLGHNAVWPLYEKCRSLFPVGDWDLAMPLLNGWIEVDLFFVLSGSLITHHLLNGNYHNPLSNMGRYLFARGLHILPTYLAVLALVALGAFPFYHVAQEHMTIRVLYHLLFLQDYIPSNILVPFHGRSGSKRNSILLRRCLC